MTEIEIKGTVYKMLPIAPYVKDVIKAGNNRLMYYYTDGTGGAANPFHFAFDILFRYSTATESDFEKVVDEPIEGYYLNYRGDNFVCTSAAQSFRQLLIKHSLDPNADYIILKRK